MGKFEHRQDGTIVINSVKMPLGLCFLSGHLGGWALIMVTRLSKQGLASFCRT